MLYDRSTYASRMSLVAASCLWDLVILKSKAEKKINIFFYESSLKTQHRRVGGLLSACIALGYKKQTANLN